MPKYDLLKNKLTEALLSDEVTPSASKRISRLLEELAHKAVSEERLDAMERELADIMASLTGPTVNELKDRMPNLGIIELLKLWFRRR